MMALQSRTLLLQTTILFFLPQKYGERKVNLLLRGVPDLSVEVCPIFVIPHLMRNLWIPIFAGWHFEEFIP